MYQSIYNNNKRKGHRNQPKRKDSAHSEPEKRKRELSESEQGSNKTPKRSQSVSSTRSDASSPSPSTSRSRPLAPNWLWDESFEKHVQFPSKNCRRCGYEGHDKKSCNAKVSCKYFFCRWEWNKYKDHDIRICPNIVLACNKCKVRGHPPGKACEYSRNNQRSAFEEHADEHLLLRWRHTVFSWGHYTLPNRSIAEKLAKETSYDKLMEMPIRDVQVMVKNLSA